jgi:SAM-dependent methyltransferase
MQDFFRKSAQTALRRVPTLRPLMFSAIDRLIAPLLYGFALRHPRPPAAPPPSGEADVTAFNAAAEEYFARYPDPAHLLHKPFSEPAALSRRFIDIGVLIDGLRLVPGDTVLELGAGSCWVSHLLNRFGCRTIAVDVSPSALALGRTLFERDSSTNWSLKPEFLPYDGHTLPVTDGSVNAIILYDAFHHLPNQEALLLEMWRVLSVDGIVGMSEPGRGHADSAPSQAESGDSGVLETELVLEDIAHLATRVGFASARCIVAPNTPLMEIDATDLRAFMKGHGFSRYWSELCAALDSHYFVLLFKSDPEPTTRRPKHLKAVISTSHALPLAADVGEAAQVTVLVKNTGDTRWLCAPDVKGWTRVGAHLYEEGTSRRLIDYDWFRAPLPADVLPGQTATLSLTLPPLKTRGRYLIVIDLVVEGLIWFADRESSALSVECLVGRSS